VLPQTARVVREPYLGNRVFPEDRADQILAGAVLTGGFVLVHEPPVCCLQVLFRIELRPVAALGSS
jgi:hypothetical protein